MVVKVHRGSEPSFLLLCRSDEIGCGNRRGALFVFAIAKNQDVVAPLGVPVVGRRQRVIGTIMAFVDGECW